MTEINGADFVIAAKHPRREGPLVVRTKAGELIGVSGDSCAGVPQAHLVSMLGNGYLARVEEAS